MTLTTQPRHTRRLYFAACCGAPDSPLSESEKLAVLRCLADHTWAPTPQDTPVPFGAVEAWYHEQERRGLARRPRHA
jgi:hypothetical protein